MHKKHILVDSLQLARTISNEQSYSSQKTRLVHLGTFPELWTVMDGLLVSFWHMLGLHARLLDQNGAVVPLT